MTRYHEVHPCRCDDCYKARDSELQRAREAERQRVVTIIDGCAVHGDKPMNAESLAAIAEVIRAVKMKLSQ